MPPRRRGSRTTLVLALAWTLVLASCDDASPPAEPGPASSEPAATPEQPAASARSAERRSTLPDPVDAEDAASPLRLNVYSKAGYWSADGTLMIDVLEGELVYATVMITDAEDRPVRGIRPSITPERESRFIPTSGASAVSADLGNYQFGMLGGTMGEERVEITVDDAAVSLILNVISERASGYAWLADIEGVLDWRTLLEAEVSWTERELVAVLPDEVRAKNGQTVRLVGFVMPIEATLEQKHFLLTSSPPGCFFHVPGGAAGAVEVFASKSLDLGFDPVVFEGRFEALEASETGVIYRLHDARVLDPPRRSPET
jgi:hypothetical protein